MGEVHGICFGNLKNATFLILPFLSNDVWQGVIEYSSISET